MKLPDIWKAIVGQEFFGILVGTPRTIGGVVVIDVEDVKGKRWTSPTVSRLSELIVKATYEAGLLKVGYKVWWSCDGESPSRRGKPTTEFSIRFTDGDKIVWERILIKKKTLRDMVASGKLTLEDALRIQEGS